MKSRFIIDEDTGIEYRDEGPWRSYHLYGEGNSATELYASLAVAEVDQDGGDLTSYSLDEASQPVIDAALAIFTRVLLDSIRDQPALLHPDTQRLTIKAKHLLSMHEFEGLYGALNVLFQSGYGPLSEAEIKAVNIYLSTQVLKEG